MKVKHWWISALANEKSGQNFRMKNFLKNLLKVVKLEMMNWIWNVPMIGRTTRKSELEPWPSSLFDEGHSKSAKFASILAKRASLTRLVGGNCSFCGETLLGSTILSSSMNFLRKATKLFVDLAWNSEEPALTNWRGKLIGFGLFGSIIDSKEINFHVT